MKQNKASQSGAATVVLDAQDEGQPSNSLLSGWRRPSDDASPAPKRRVKFFADWSAGADHEKPKP